MTLVPNYDTANDTDDDTDMFHKSAFHVVWGVVLCYGNSCS